MDKINFNSVESLPGYNAKAAFTVNSASVFREENNIVPVVIDDKLSYMPWGGDNMLPYNILNLIESDETLSTCQMFNAEVCYGSGLVYNTDETAPAVKEEIEDFFLENDIATYFHGVCQDFKHFGFCVSVIILSADGTKVASLYRKEACYCRFSPADKDGRITKLLYANWRKPISDASQVEVIDLLDMRAPWADLKSRGLIGVESGEWRVERASSINNNRSTITSKRKFAIVTRVPTPDSTYYPIPYYASLFKGKWYNIKQLIGMAKEAKLKNSAPIKYHIEISAKYWEQLFRSESITDRKKQQERVVEEKQNILDFLTGVENSGKAWFSTFYISPDGHENHDVVINKIETDKEGGDWSTDIIEAVNMFCFTMRVHSNLVGSVPGKSQSNNSGSDKRELYTIAQALQKPYHDLLFGVHRIIIKFNGWKGAFPDCPFVMLTTLNEHTDAKVVTADGGVER